MVLVSLSSCKKFDSGIVQKIDESRLIDQKGLIIGDVESRLLEMGFIEGAKLQVLHLGALGKDPIAVRINNSNSIIALRKNEASAVLLEKI